jgi:hypothetical protein
LSQQWNFVECSGVVSSALTGCRRRQPHAADGDYGWGLLLRTLADVLQHDRRPAVVDAALEMVFGLLTSYGQRWDAPAWRVLIQRVVRHMLTLPPGLSPPLPPAACDALAAPVAAAPRVPGGQQGSFSFAAASGGGSGVAGFGSPLSAAGLAGSPAGAAAAAAALAAAGGSSGSGSGSGSGRLLAGAFGGAGGAVPAGLSVAERGMLMTTLLQRMDRYYPLLCEQAAAMRPEYQVGALGVLALSPATACVGACEPMLTCSTALTPRLTPLCGALLPGCSRRDTD